MFRDGIIDLTGAIRRSLIELIVEHGIRLIRRRESNLYEGENRCLRRCESAKD